MAFGSAINLRATSTLTTAVREHIAPAVSNLLSLFSAQNEQSSHRQQGSTRKLEDSTKVITSDREFEEFLKERERLIKEGSYSRKTAEPMRLSKEERKEARRNAISKLNTPYDEFESDGDYFKKVEQKVKFAPPSDNPNGPCLETRIEYDPFNGFDPFTYDLLDPSEDCTFDEFLENLDLKKLVKDTNTQLFKKRVHDRQQKMDKLKQANNQREDLSKKPLLTEQKNVELQKTVLRSPDSVVVNDPVLVQKFSDYLDKINLESLIKDMNQQLDEKNFPTEPKKIHLETTKKDQVENNRIWTAISAIIAFIIQWTRRQPANQHDYMSDITPPPISIATEEEIRSQRTKIETILHRLHEMLTT